MTIMNAIASVPVKDLKASVPWYQKVLGRAPESTPMTEVAEWKFERGGWLQVYARANPGGGSVTLAVSSLDEQIEHLKRIGIDPGTPMRSAEVNVVMIKDPDGNSLAFAEALDPALAR
jgi:predicted enzyme related to lactoylglutathione lyase